MRRKIYDVTKLILVKSFAQKFVKKNGTVGVTRQYIETLIDRKKNKGFEPVEIDGVRFINVIDPKVIGKPSRAIEKMVAKPPVTKIDKQIRPEHAAADMAANLAQLAVSKVANPAPITFQQL